MTKYFLRLLLLIAAIIGVLLLFEQLLPRSYDFQQSVEIDSPNEEIFPYLNSLKKWPQWSQQFNMQVIDGLVIKYSGTDEGVGAAQTWTTIRGPGKIWISESNPSKSITYLGGEESFPPVTSTFLLDPSADGKTLVTWRSKGQLPRTPLFGLMNVISVYETQMEYQYEKSLAALKALVEQQN